MLGYVCCFADVWFKGRNGGRPCLVKAGTMLSESFRVFQSEIIVLITIADLSLLKDLKELNTATRKHQDVQLAVRPD